MPRSFGFLLIAWDSVSIAILNNNGANGQPCRMPDLTAHSCDIIPLTKNCAVVPSCNKPITLIN
ncbi:hypothetical protein PF005_g17017 [Phytophthora fragariae]|uniref:Pectate lyase n=1 Tax=Phytophthora fragariae TaxID=53985 RepID=A0A6A3RF41_9STRA|nr:hypothetical protein PF003_g21212 [Phytophthora fragariae]KAE8931696.1 hypothetical protein PF009_g18254 [Phytophthora fragariae]KAE8996305.1 hypothetical protein PF011_g15964 [Phytophthora fragariae]KAE9095783.1 hypothetical protein PF010_g16582 [Phytophthora fragariae]KAE9096022.1 hypothetical protein PF007_g17169 [Phytophthora fragariae]